MPRPRPPCCGAPRPIIACCAMDERAAGRARVAAATGRRRTAAANPDVRGGGVSTDVAECKTAILRPTFRPTNRRLSASCVQWAVGPRWTTPRFRFWCFSTSVSRPTEKVFGFSISKHHQSTDPDGGPFGGCSGTSKTMGKHESPYGNRRFRVSGGAGTRGTGGGFAPPDPPLASD